MIMMPLRHIAELTMIFSIPEVSGVTPNSRIDALQKKLQKEAKKQLGNTLVLMNPSQRRRVSEVMYQWGQASGWYGETRHIGTLVCFCGQLIDNSPFKFNREIALLLGDIIDCLYHYNIFYAPCVWGGVTAADKWKQIFEEKTV